MAKTIKTTRLQTRGLAAPDEDSGSARQRKKSLASRAMRRVPAKHKILRPAMFVTVGLFEMVGKGLKISGKWSGQQIKAKVSRDLAYRKWTPPPLAVAGRKWYAPTVDMTCCGKHYHAVDRLNEHLVKTHRGQKRAFQASAPTVQRSHTSKTAGKTIVRPATAGGGRHRARHNIPDAKRALDLVAAYKQQIADTRKRVEKIMSDNPDAASAALKRAGNIIGKITVNGRTPLSEFYEMMVGIEVGMNSVADGINDLGLMLRSERGARVDPALVRPFMDRAVAYIQNAGSAFTSLAVAFDEVYGPVIALERARAKANAELEKPNINMAR